PSLRDAVAVFWRIGLLSFGGPAAQIALMHRMLVDENQWLSETQYLNALSFCMLLPGPEAMQLATYAGWRLHGTRGGLLAGLLFIIPGAVVMLLLSIAYAWYGETQLLSALFFGVKAAVLVIVIQALLRLVARSLKGVPHWLVAGLAFVALFFFNLPFPLVVVMAGIYGFLATPREPNQPIPAVLGISPRRTLRTMTTWLVIWLAPLAVISALSGGGLFQDLSLLFSKLATVSFGGAYAVLAYLAQDAVQQYGWLSAAEMVDGLGLAESTPGPLILVTEFVGFIAGVRSGGELNLARGMGAALVTLWATFAPCFLWVFAGAPYIEWLTAKPRLRGSLRAISAAVVGVILNLSLWFALHVLFSGVSRVTLGPLNLWLPDMQSFIPSAFAIALLATGLLFIAKWGVAKTLLVCAIAGLVFQWVLA
ncbi:chromate efflux transporter, partial [Gammaproteobacteria bacterium]|nr:chromate efflux transporter [Gammaproteobacteria bacterium]